jgi:hypothetical protein
LDKTVYKVISMPKILKIRKKSKYKLFMRGYGGCDFLVTDVIKYKIGKIGKTSYKMYIV